MKKLYALLIAINDYPTAGHRLRGCLHDLEAIHAYLEEHCRLHQLDFKPRILTNEQATRDNILSAFGHFDKISAEDGGLLYYSGHGSRMNTPAEFRHIDTDGKCESIVCYDSRQQGGRDLSDKELSYLIWKATPQNPLHFLALLDCCHAGGATRNTEVRPRMTTADDRPVQIKDLIGHQHHLVEQGRRRPPVGPHIAFAASAARESSVETQIDGAVRGVFTCALLNALQQSNLRFLTYEELLSRVQTRIYHHYNRQHPQLNYYGSPAHTLFLNGAVSAQARQLVHHQPNNGWVVELGAIHHVPAGADVRIEENHSTLRKATVRTVHPSQSTLTGMDWAEPGRSYYLRDIVTNRPPLPVFLAIETAATTSEEARWRELAGAVDLSPALQSVSDPAHAYYHLQLDARRGWTMTRPGEARPVFKAIPAVSPAATQRFLQYVEKVAVWEATSALSNPLCQLDLSSELNVELFRVTEHRQYREVLAKEAVDIFSDPVYEYEYRDGQWREPALMLQVSKQKGRPGRLWVGGLFFSEDYGITDQFLPMKEIRPGEAPYEFSFYDPNTGRYQSILPLYIPRVILEWGEREIVNRIKIVAATQRLPLANFNQPPLELEPRNTRGAGRKRLPSSSVVASSDWATLDINLRIRQPK